MDPATTYCFSVLSWSSVSLLRRRLSRMICFDVEPIHCPREMSGNVSDKKRKEKKDRERTHR